MLFHSDLTFVLALIALAMGALVLLKAKKFADLGTKPCRVIGYLIVILALLALIFSGYWAVQSCRLIHTKYGKQLLRMHYGAKHRAR
jgi:hypothetical protein